MTKQRYITIKQRCSDNCTILAKALLITLVGLISACQKGFNDFRLYEQPVDHIQTKNFFLHPGDNVVGRMYKVRSHEGETLPDIARHFGLGFNEIARANKDLNVWQLPEGSKVILPLQFILPDTPRDGMVLNLANMRLFYFPGQLEKEQYSSVLSFPIGIGKKGWSTPLGVTKITAKTKNPNWYVPASIRREHALKGDPLPAVVKSGPENPLGQYALRLGFPGYLIHGTNKPYGVGLRVSHGCVRLYPKHIAELFAQVAVGTRVRIVDQPYLIGWRGEMLYLEAHASAGKKNNRKKINNKLQQYLEQNPAAIGKVIDWQQVEKILNESPGIPLPVLERGMGYLGYFEQYPLVKRPEVLLDMPVVPRLLPGEWSVYAASFSLSEHAVKLSAMLNHQGPQIPSRVLESGNNFYVVAGPFKNKNQAKKVAKRIQREFELKAKVQKFTMDELI